jgi:hypothetical protein
MINAKLKFDGREINIGEGITTLGRASDNNVSFINDPNVSRYHAEIETQGEDFWLIELGSSNGTTVNGEKVTSEILLKNGDKILLGGSSEVVFVTEEEDEEPKEESGSETASAVGGDSVSDEESEDAETADEKTDAAEEPAKSSKMTWLFGCAGITFGLAIISIFAAILFTQCGSPPPDMACSPKARIVSPTIGDTIEKTIEIKADIEDADCIEKVTFYVDGQKIKEVSEPPFRAELNPDQFPDLADGFPHTIWIDLEDDTNEKMEQAVKVEELYFETREVEVSENDLPTDEEDQNSKKPEDKTEKTSIIKLNDLSKNFIKTLPANSQFSPSAEFLEEVQKLMPEYTSPGYFARAAKYRDVINEAYIKEKGLDASLGYILAMSRTKFILQQSKTGEGLWAMPVQFVTENNYNAACPGESLSDESQNCAAKSSSEYMKTLVVTVFDGDVVYSVANFGKSTQAALARKAQLPPDHANFWKILTRRERDQVARYFAAAIVTQNPKEFGLKDDRPLSELYKFDVAN